MRLDDGRICVAFGDVSGKGIPAALVMARLASAVQTTVQLARSLREGLQTVNDHMCKRASGGRFVTFVALLLDPRSHTVEIVNAGHRAPFLRTADGRVEALAPDVTGVPLGIVEGFEYESERRVVEPGDVIVLFTDGIDEAKSPGGEEYGAERLAACIGRTPKEAEIGAAVLQEVRAFSAGRPPSDDIALMTVTRSS
jgi:serine phosphatase RsbU (regulator of sigma subunit)